MSRQKGLLPEFIGLELQAIAYLCGHWANRCRGRTHKDNKSLLWRKILSLREAVLLGQGGREKWEDELVQDEVATMQFVVQKILKQFEVDQLRTKRNIEEKRIKIPFCLDEGGVTAVIDRPMPGPHKRVEQALERFGDKRSSDMSIAKSIVSSRLGISKQQIRDSLRSKRRLGKTSPAQRLAVSIFYDLSLSPPPQAQQLRWKILNALAESGYPPICLYYVVQRTQTLKRLQPTIKICGKQTIQELCDLLRASASNA